MNTSGYISGITFQIVSEFQLEILIIEEYTIPRLDGKARAFPVDLSEIMAKKYRDYDPEQT
ncbi:MAG: hypothetical protein ACLFVL_07955, partial [Candidatus Aenigmatarchaeota archaeon]